MEFCKAFNAKTQTQGSTIVPVEITVFEDRSFTFITKTPPAAVLLREALGIDKGSGEPNRTKVGTVSRAQVHGRSLTSEVVTDCIEQVLYKLQFPEPKGAGVVAVRYPFTFASGG